jgi:uncharacterized protein YbaR (Trm112 family)
MDSKLLEMLVCPVSKTALHYHRESEELWCRASRLAYPIRDGFPVLIEDEARPLTQDEYDSLT